MSASKNLSSLLLLICLSIHIGKIQALSYESASYNISFDEFEAISNSLTTPGLAFTACNNSRYDEGEILCTLARETVSDLGGQDHFQYCNLTASVGEKIYRKKTEALGDDKAVMFVEHPESVTLLIIDMLNCRYVTSSLYKIYVDFASVRGWNESFFDILYTDDFGQNHRRWTLDVNGTVVVPPQDEAFKYFKKDKYMYSPAKGLLLFGKPNASGKMGLYAIDGNGSTELLKEYPTTYYHELVSHSLSSYGFLSACFGLDNGTEACAQYDSNATLKFETYITPKGIFSFLNKVQNLPDGGLLLIVGGCIGVDYDDDDYNDCAKSVFLKKISPDGKESGQLKMTRHKCERFTPLSAMRFFQKPDGDICLSLLCAYKRNNELNLSLTCVKNEDFQSDDLLSAVVKRPRKRV